MSRTATVHKTLKIPAALFERVREIQEKEGLNDHALLLQLIEEGVKAHAIGDAQKRLKEIKAQVSHMGSELDALFRRKP